jgi:hypothetical protein
MRADVIPAQAILENIPCISEKDGARTKCAAFVGCEERQPEAVNPVDQLVR